MANKTQPTDAPTLKASHRGLAPKIRKLKLKHPELSHSDIARKVGCSPSNVTCVLKTFLGKTTEAELKDFQESKADVYDALQVRLLSSLTPAKIEKAKPMEIITGAAILEDKARLVRGQATGINVTVLMDVVEAMRARSAQPTQSRAIGGESAGQSAGTLRV